MVSDLHHLYPVHEVLNNIRSNHKFTDDNMGTHVVPFIIPVSSKGNVARAAAYFDIRYNFTEHTVNITDVISIKDIVEWNIVDTVNSYDRYRNEMAFKCQNNRNPFIMFPELVDFVYCNGIDVKDKIEIFCQKYHSVRNLEPEILKISEKNNILNVWKSTIVDNIAPLTQGMHRSIIIKKIDGFNDTVTREEFEQILEKSIDRDYLAGLSRKQGKKYKRKLRRKLRKRYKF